MSTAVPFILNHPRITLNAGSTTPLPVNIECNANEVHTNVSQDENTVDTFCGSYTSYKPEKWDVTLQGVQSFGADGLWTTVRPLVGQIVPFELLGDRDAAVSVDNPLMSGECLVKAFPFIDAAVGEASEFDVVLAVQGDPIFEDIPGAMMAAAAADTGASAKPATPSS
jgi:hypothetical protein